MANRNRRAGTNWERAVIKKLNELSNECGSPASAQDEDCFKLFPKLGSTREYNRDLDGRKVDIVTTNPEKLADFGYLIQCKSKAGGSVNYIKIMREMEENLQYFSGIKVIFHESTHKKTDKNGKIRFFRDGNYAILKIDDFIEMMRKIAEYEKKIGNS